MCSSSDGLVGCPILAGDELMTQQLSRNEADIQRARLPNGLGSNSRLRIL
jgi:hypothetical protein